MKKILYIEKHIKKFQICKKLSKIAKKFKNSSKKLKNILHFSKKIEKNNLFENKINYKNKHLRDRFFFQIINIFQFIFNHRLLFLFLTKFN